ncbi:hypothetical protein PCO31111_04707 [Pandoraea communis]|uniref:Uncharacterized protein n=1 Tax=Pandoraea communis TaxID=2508297 RepID=A0A5E4YPQ1_9BURK|nr:hypothetical protein PCO31111_04707 [Pandoraea communis]
MPFMPVKLTHRDRDFSHICGETMTLVAPRMLGAALLVIYDIQHLVLEK